MCQLEEIQQVQSFFMMDENFLLRRKRALRLLELMEEHDKAWALYVFSSANVLRSYAMEQLIGLGVSWVWMGLEGENSQYAKLHGIDTYALIRRLQAHGIRVLGSTIIGLENHTHKNIDDVIEYAVRYNTDFHQFMLYTAIPGTPLYKELEAKGLMKDPDEYLDCDIHGQCIFNYRHPHIRDGQETEFIERAFVRDFEVNGPSVIRVFQTTLAGWKRYKKHPNPRIRRRFAWEAKNLATRYSAATAAAKLYYRDNPIIHAQLASLLGDLNREFGWKSRLMSLFGGRYILRQIRCEEKRLASGWTYEPPTYYERNADSVVPAEKGDPKTVPCHHVSLRTIAIPTNRQTVPEQREPAAVG
jgi:hypothetical protein